MSASIYDGSMLTKGDSCKLSCLIGICVCDSFHCSVGCSPTGCLPMYVDALVFCVHSSKRQVLVSPSNQNRRVCGKSSASTPNVQEYLSTPVSQRTQAIMVPFTVILISLMWTGETMRVLKALDLFSISSSLKSGCRPAQLE